MKQRDMNAEVAKYWGLCESLASRMARPGEIKQNGVEYDDLVQVGIIYVWQTLEKGETPASESVRMTMLSHIRDLGRQKRGGQADIEPLEEDEHEAEGGEVS